MGPTSTRYPNRIFVLRMADRIGIAFEGWLHALPFVLISPMIFWFLFAVSQMTRWSWQTCLEVCDYGLPLIGMALLGHLFAFLIVGLPLFLIFWGKRSIIWQLPVSLLLGGALGALTGIPFYCDILFGGRVDLPLFLVCLGYGVATAFGCWLANRRNAGSMRKASSLALSVAFCVILVLDAPAYAFCGNPRDPRFGCFYADPGVEGWLVAGSFEDFIRIFLDQHDETLLNA